MISVQPFVKMYKFMCLCVFVGLLAVLNGQNIEAGAQAPVAAAATHGRVVVCYVATWAVYRPGDGSFPLDQLDPTLCTHLVYSFAGLDAETDSIKSLDPWQDLTDNYGKGGYSKLVALKQRYPHLKVTLAVGGWNEGSEKYSKMAAAPAARARFVRSAVGFLQRFGFDGLDLDWEYPAKRGGKPEDKENFVKLVRELKEAFEPHGMIVTAALGAGRETLEAAYDLPRLSRYLDYLHLMCYDYHGAWDSVVGANAPLSAPPDDFLSVEYSVRYMLSHGVSNYKLVLGLPLYGRTFQLAEPAVKDIRFGLTAAQSRGFSGPYTKEAGFMGYNEICMELSNSSSNWQRLWDDGSSTPYLRSGERVIAYDNPRSLAMKVKLAVEHELGGVMVWSIDTDDFRGECAQDDDAFVDFRSRLDLLRRSPVLDDVLHELNLPDGSHHEIPLRGNRSAYVVDHGALTLRVPARAHNNYPLMRTVSEALLVAQQERRIDDALERRMRENEIVDEGRVKGGGAAAAGGGAAWLLALGLLALL